MPSVRTALACGLCGLGLLAAAAPARADLTPVTAPTIIFDMPTVYRTYVAFDESKKVYMSVGGSSRNRRAAASS